MWRYFSCMEIGQLVYQGVSRVVRLRDDCGKKIHRRDKGGAVTVTDVDPHDGALPHREDGLWDVNGPTPPGPPGGYC
jgi:hypothetical protein